jgi:hypothetical protein
MSRFLALPAALFALVPAIPVHAQKQIVVQQQLVLPGGGIVPAAGKQPKAANQTISDDEALKSAGLSATDGEKLIGYLKLRTVSDAEQGKINTLIKKLGADLFVDRIKAGEELEIFGPAAIGLLRAAEKDSDPEIAHQAGRVLRRMEKIPHSAVAAAAVRAVVKTKPPGAAAALLGFLPLADSDSLADDIRGALVALAAPGGKPEPALVAALEDKSPVRRGAAYIALLEGGEPGERVRIKDSFEQVKAALRKEADVPEKFRGLWSMALVARDKDAVAELIGMVPQLPRGRIWQLEDLLIQLAGEAIPGGRFGRTPESLEKARDAWLAWWEKKGPAFDFAKLAYKPRILGITDVVEWNRNDGNGRFVSLGPDLKEKHKFYGNSLFDAKFINGRYHCIENYGQVIERDPDGTQHNARNLNQPVAIESLPNGGMLIVTRQFIHEYGKDGKEVWNYQRQNTADIASGCRLPNGETLFITVANAGDNCFRLDAKGKLIMTEKNTPKGMAVGRMLNYGYAPSVEAVGEDKILMCEQQRVAEYDLKTGKAGWTYNVSQPTSAQRLPNGNTLIAAFNNGNPSHAIEVDTAGEVLWEHKSKDGYSILKAYRR